MSWTWNKAMQKKIYAFEYWCYRRMLKINVIDRVSNKEVLKRILKMCENPYKEWGVDAGEFQKEEAYFCGDVPSVSINDMF